MTFKIKKSFIRANPDFEVQVAAHAIEMRDWLAREEKVASQAPNVPEAERWVSCVRPAAPNHFVESAVNEKGEADYLVDNDDPAPEEVLRFKKSRLVEQLRVAEAIAHEAVHPMLKRPLQAMVEADARAKEASIRSDVVAENSATVIAAIDDHHKEIDKFSDSVGTLLKAAAKVGLAKLPDPPVYVEPQTVDVGAEARSRLSAEEASALDESVRIATADAAVARAAAKAMSDIDDLTVDDVDAYQIPDLTRG